jgi:hypothetical protein
MAKEGKPKCQSEKGEVAVIFRHSRLFSLDNPSNGPTETDKCC